MGTICSTFWIGWLTLDAVGHLRKAPLLRFGRIFRPGCAVRKDRNTWSIPVFPNLQPERNLSPKPTKKAFLRMPNGDTSTAAIFSE